MTLSTSSMRIFGVVAFAASLIGFAAAVSKPDVIDLPTGFYPGGITLGEGWTAYVGSNTDGSIWKGDLLTGEGEIVLAGPGAPELTEHTKQTSYYFTSGVSGVVPNAPGLDHDRRSGYLFVAGGYSGIRIYDENFDIVAEYDLDGASRQSFVGDVIVTKTAAYFTDSIQLKIHKGATLTAAASSHGRGVQNKYLRSYHEEIELNRYDGGLTNGPDAAVESFTLGAGIYNSGEGIDLNGIEATDDGTMLIVGTTTNTALYAVDPANGDTTRIDIGDADGNGQSLDGLVVRRNTIWAVGNGDWGAPEEIAEISLSADLSCGIKASRVLKDALFNNPTKMLRKGNAFYVVNSKFEELAQDRPSTSYEIIRVDRDSGEYECEDE